MRKIEPPLKTGNNALKAKRKRKIAGPANDGLNTPVPDASSVHVPAASEAALIKQAENPLGDPDKV
jgi:hypothetical protein